MHKLVYVRRKDGVIAVYLGDDYPFKVGDRVTNAKHSDMVVTRLSTTDSTSMLGKELKQLVPINKQSNSMDTNSMFSGVVNKYKSQFIPEKEKGIRMSLTGLLCIPVDGEYIGIDKDNSLTSFPLEMTIDLPVYSINKVNANVQVGDIVKTGRNFAKVVGKNADGSLKILSYSGVTHNKKDVKDFIMGQATTRVLVNMFNFDDKNGFNPIFFAAASGDSLDVESLMMLSMTPQGKNLFSNAGGSFNPMMLMMLDKNKQNGNSSNFMETMMMMSMMQGNNPFAQMQSPFAGVAQPAQTTTENNTNAQ